MNVNVVLSCTAFIKIRFEVNGLISFKIFAVEVQDDVTIPGRSC